MMRLTMNVFNYLMIYVIKFKDSNQNKQMINKTISKDTLLNNIYLKIKIWKTYNIINQLKIINLLLKIKLKYN